MPFLPTPPQKMRVPRHPTGLYVSAEAKAAYDKIVKQHDTAMARYTASSLPEPSPPSPPPELQFTPSVGLTDKQFSSGPFAGFFGHLRWPGEVVTGLITPAALGL